eukprot:gene27860-34419_t
MSWLTSFFRSKPAPEKPVFKEKFSALYEDLLDGGQPHGYERTSLEDILDGRWVGSQFWEELLLLKVNQTLLQDLLGSLTEARLFEIKGVVSEISTVCVHYLSDYNLLRISHSLETLTLLFQQIGRKRFSERGLGLIK